MRWIITSLFLLRAVQYLILYITPAQFDTSTTILINEYITPESRIIYPTWMQKVLQGCMSWDAVYILKLSMSGILFEHEWVFAPLWWRFMQRCRTFVEMYTGYEMNLYDVTLTFVLLNNLITVAIAVTLYKICIIVAEKDFKMMSGVNPSKFAYYASILVITQPSGIFSATVYSEPPSQLLCYLGILIYLRARSTTQIISWSGYLASGVLFAIAFGIRSNCIFYGLLYIYDIIAVLRKPTDLLCALMTGGILFAALVTATYAAWVEYCPQRGEWCLHGTRSLVSYAQSHYWNVGLFKYFTMGNVPLFIMGAPQFVILIMALERFRTWKSLRGVWIVTFVYIVVQFSVMHVQIINRVCTFVPFHLMYVAWGLCRDTVGMETWIVRYWIFWIILQTALFSTFLPPA
jgi:GPI mannosyltransferase 2